MTIRKRIENLEQRIKPEPVLTCEVALIDEDNNTVKIMGSGKTMTLDEYERTKNDDTLNIMVYPV